MIRVLVAEDSHSVRLLLVMLLESDPEIQVVGQVADGLTAVESARRLRPDVITMDIHMPGLDGLEATARIMNEFPTPIVVVSSSVSAQDVASSFGAMKAGALVALPKPGSAEDSSSQDDRRMFVATVKAMAGVKVVRRWSGSYAAMPERGAPPERKDTGLGPHDYHLSSAAVTNSAPPSTNRARVSLVAIAASTGGPTALQRVLSDLPATFSAPIVLVQHIARGFLPGFATWLDGECALRVKVADSSEPLEAGVVYVAPDDRHLQVTASRRTSLVSGAPVNGFCPSGSVLFESAAKAYGASLAAVIMTGMGNDGVSGLRQVKARGGHVIAQDRETSLIYGMPGEAVNEGIVDNSLPLSMIASHLLKLVS